MSQQPNQNDNSMDFLMLGGLLLFAIWGAWMLLHGEIVAMAFYIWDIQAKLIAPFDSSILQMTHWMSTHEAGDIGWEQFQIIGAEFAGFSRWIALIGLCTLAFYVFSNSPKERFKRKMNMDTLAICESGNWPQTLPFVKMKLIDQDPDKGPWASAPTPREYAKKNGILNADGSYNISMATAIFEKQLGRLFTNLMSMPKHMQYLFAIFALRVNGDDDGSKAYAKFLATCTTEAKVDFSRADALMLNYMVNRERESLAKEKTKIKKAVLGFRFGEAEKSLAKLAGLKLKIIQMQATSSILRKIIVDNTRHNKILKLTKMHAYESTFMTSMLQIARGSGICNDTDFLCWLKPIDRTLWYALNQTGRRVAWVEAAGIRSHWLAEITANRKIEDPMLTSAIEAMGDELADTMDLPEDEIKFRY